MSKKKQVVLVQIISAQKTQTYDLDKSEFILGRGDTSAIPIVEGGISREHVKVRVQDGLVQIQDLNSSNGTLVEGIKLNPMEFVPVRETYTVTFGNSGIKAKFKLVEVSDEINKEVNAHDKNSDHPPIQIDLSAFPKNQEDFKVSFKNVGLSLPKYKNATEHAQEIIKEAEYIKHSMIKSAEVYKTKVLNEAKIQAQQASEQAYSEYQKLVDRLLDDSRRELQRLKTEAEIMLDDKRLQANEEIQTMWKEHREQIRRDKEKHLEVIEKENIIKLELSIEKMKSDMFSERNRLITEAENEILVKKRSFQVEFENEKAEHTSRIKLYSEELVKIQNSIAECEKILRDSKSQREESELDLVKTLSQLKQEKENLEFVTKQFAEIVDQHKAIEKEISQFREMKNNFTLERDQAEKKLDDLNRSYSTMVEKRDQLTSQIQTLTSTLDDQKMKAKAEVEAEYAKMKDIEQRKFEDYKSNQLKELQKIRDEHTNSIKKFSVDLSQEIATKIELLAKKAGQQFDFDKNFELINSVIQVKSAINTGSESKHTEQLDSWKKRKRKENFNLISSGVAAGVFLIFFGQMAYKKLNTDPVQEELARMAVERKQKESQNLYVPVKTSKYHDNYVDATLFTENFAETYLDDAHQQEWVNYATKYFLRQWKVEETSVIKVISSSRAFVQTVDEARPTLKKDRIKTDLEKLKAEEQANISSQANLLGSNVRYEAYKKLEKEFFVQRLNQRGPANK